MTLGEGVLSSPLVEAGTIYFGSDDGRLYALRGELAATPSAAWRAVYWDPRMALSFFEDGKALRDALVAESYRHVGRVGIMDFLAARIADREPSVVVFALDNVPESLLAESDGQPALLRRYLDAGGKVVWLGLTPFVLTFDAESGEQLGADLPDLGRVERLLGVRIDQDAEGVSRVEATPAGRAWGLPADWWIDDAGVNLPQDGLEALALDGHGHAAAWVRRFGGPPGTGFVRLWYRKAAGSAGRPGRRRVRPAVGESPAMRSTRVPGRR